MICVKFGNIQYYFKNYQAKFLSSKYVILYGVNGESQIVQNLFDSVAKIDNYGFHIEKVIQFEFYKPLQFKKRLFCKYRNKC